MAIVTLGLTMLTRWIPVHVAYVAAEAKAGRPAEFDFPAERAFPLSVIVTHGLLAATTFTLVLLTVLTSYCPQSWTVRLPTVASTAEMARQTAEPDIV